MFPALLLNYFGQGALLLANAAEVTQPFYHLALSPRTRIIQISSEEIGQIYIPAVNWALMIAVIALVLGFRTSSNLAAAYGVAVTTTMVITTVLAFFIMRERWRWPSATAWPVAVLFLSLDVAFFGANMLKVEEGGWFPQTGAGIASVILCATIESVT